MTTELELFGPAGITLDPDAFAPDGVRGADKAAQRFVYGLLTPAGTVPGRPADGSTFLSLVAGFRSEFDVFAAFAAAEPAAAATARAAELDDDPPGERLGAARLTGFDLAGDTLTLTIAVVAADGTPTTRPVAFAVAL